MVCFNSWFWTLGKIEQQLAMDTLLCTCQVGLGTPSGVFKGFGERFFANLVLLSHHHLVEWSTVWTQGIILPVRDMKKNNGSGTPLASVQLFLTNCQVLNSRDLVTLLQPSQPLIGAKKTSDIKVFPRNWYTTYLYIVIHNVIFFTPFMTSSLMSLVDCPCPWCPTIELKST